MSSTFLLTWNPKKSSTQWIWENVPSSASGFEVAWSCGNAKKICKGDRIFMIRLGAEPKGVYASGKALSESYKEGEGGKTSRRIDVRIDRIIDPAKNNILGIRKLVDEVSEKFPSLKRPWIFKGLGIEIPSEIAIKLENVWREFSQKTDELHIADNKKALMIPANPEKCSVPANGDIDAHIEHIKKEGAVFWDLVPPGRISVSTFNYPEISRGYFYNVPNKKITHEFEVEYIKTGSEVDEGEKKYVMESRKMAWKKGVREAFFWVKISTITLLEKELLLQDFKKANDGQPLRRLMNYSIAIDPDLTERCPPSLQTKEKLDREQAFKESQAEKLSDEALLIKALAAPPICPIVEGVPSKQFYRDEHVAAYAKRRAKGNCPLCLSPAPFINKDNNPYLETHHITWLSKGGEDSIENTAALCPNCHRKMHILNLECDQEILREHSRRRM